MTVTDFFHCWATSVEAFPAHKPVSFAGSIYDHVAAAPSLASKSKLVAASAAHKGPSIARPHYSADQIYHTSVAL
jgi:hypothetical protein